MEKFIIPEETQRRRLHHLFQLVWILHVVDSHLFGAIKKEMYRKEDNSADIERVK